MNTMNTVHSAQRLLDLNQLWYKDNLSWQKTVSVFVVVHILAISLVTLDLSAMKTFSEYFGKYFTLVSTLGNLIFKSLKCKSTSFSNLIAICNELFISFPSKLLKMSKLH